VKDPRRALALFALLAATTAPLAGCEWGDSGDNQDDGGDVTADTGPTTPEETAIETETPPAPTDTDAQRTEGATGEGDTGDPGSTAG
jgi:hypothetical protein